MGKTKLILPVLFFALKIQAATLGLELPPLKLDPKSVTISGTSSGAMMAVQMQVAHSATIQGIASFAGGPFYCARNSVKVAQDVCMKNPQSIDLVPLSDNIKSLATLKSIDDPINLAQRKILIFSGNRDSVVRMEASYRLKEQMDSFQASTQVKTDIAGEHGFPTESFGNDCDRLGMPWLQRCNFDGARWTLEGLYGPLNPKGSASKANLQAYEQKKYGSRDSNINEYGQIYIPASCRKPSNRDCRLHLALHGCKMSPEFVEDQFITNNGLNDWAETNKVVILYPATISSNLNPHGCWDWFGVTGEDYATKNAKQIKALKSMIDDLIN